jgi:hypothetical protein
MTGLTWALAEAQCWHRSQYFNVYLAAVSAANSPSAGSGAVWFKIWDWAPKYSKTTGLVFDTIGMSSFPTRIVDTWISSDPCPPAGGGITTLNFNIPKSVPSGQYLMRVEHIALHAAGSYQGAQFYIACAQLNIVGGGSGSPSPKVAIPGVYTGYEPGILIVSHWFVFKHMNMGVMWILTEMGDRTCTTSQPTSPATRLVSHIFIWVTFELY